MAPCWFNGVNAPFEFEVVIADNASTDNTVQIASAFAQQFDRVSVIRLGEKGRGRAVRAAWSGSGADILSYMDVDLSTDLSALLPLVDALRRGYDIGIGSRLLKASETKRAFKREVISRVYNLGVKAMFLNRFSDAQCGFKGIRRETARALLPFVEDNGWFMDTELLILAEKLGYRVYEVPVRWVEDVDSRVNIWQTAYSDIKGLIRLRLRAICEEQKRG